MTARKYEGYTKNVTKTQKNVYLAVARQLELETRNALLSIVHDDRQQIRGVNKKPKNMSTLLPKSPFWGLK